MRPKKSLGQNFLTSRHVVAKIVETADLSKEDTVLEIGPGKGILTQALLERSGTVIAIEKDDLLFELLKSTFKEEIQHKRLELIHGDALEFDPSDCKPLANSYKLVANIPYNITGAILEKFLSENHQPSSMVLMVQKEVADRIVARKKKPFGSAQGKESILSIAVKAYGAPRYVATVKAGNFNPKPKVDSAILAIANITRSFFKNRGEEEQFFKILKAGFAHKRKILSKNLKDYFNPDRLASAFAECDIGLHARAEDISREQWLCLSQRIERPTEKSL